MSTAVSTKWMVDKAHSEVQFKVKHLVISTVTGSLGEFDCTVESKNEDFEDAQIHFNANINSISTNNSQRDQHLRSGDFFDADRFPSLVFVSKSLKKTKGNHYELTGDLTIRNATNPVVLKVTYGGTVKDAYGNTKAGFEVEGKINRKDFDLTWNAVTEAGGVVVGEEVKILASIQFLLA